MRNVTLFSLALITVGLFGSPGYGDPEVSKARPDFAVFAPECPKIFSKDILEGLRPSDPNDGDVAEKFRPENSNGEWNQAKLELLYSCLPDARKMKIPDGFYHGAVIFPEDGSHRVLLSVMQKMGFPINREGVQSLAQLFWKGKRFNRLPNGDVMLKNYITLLPVVDERYRFPAKVYDNLSILDVRKNSLIIDYAFGEDFIPQKAYDGLLDKVATRHGFLVRDEVRALDADSNFLLGRAYLNGVFALNFVLHKAQDPSTK